jgi:hypothetical protein
MQAALLLVLVVVELKLLMELVELLGQLLRRDRRRGCQDSPHQAGASCSGWHPRDSRELQQAPGSRQLLHL